MIGPEDPDDLLSSLSSSASRRRGEAFLVLLAPGTKDTNGRSCLGRGEPRQRAKMPVIYSTARFDSLIARK